MGIHSIGTGAPPSTVNANSQVAPALFNHQAASKKSFRIRGQAEKDMMKRQASANPNEM